ncbi:MAG TPA: transposase [Thermoplasmata archaeon]|nr:transposase [Thermoplasmata archaeon]
MIPSSRSSAARLQGLWRSFAKCPQRNEPEPVQDADTEHCSLAERVFKCQSCGLVIDRDVNAATNTQVPLGERELTPVETPPLLPDLTGAVVSIKQELYVADPQCQLPSLEAHG